jgi:uncharacterized protein (TIGR02452 family)
MQRKANMNKLKNDFDHIKWMEQFEIVSVKKDGFREMRAKIFQDTLRFVQAGAYHTGGISIPISNENVVESAEFFDAPEPLEDGGDFQTKFSVINSDCLEAAQLLLNAGRNPCVLNLASGRNPGGGVIRGAGAQEENLFRRTNLFRSLYQFASYADEYGLKKHEKNYPLNQDTGGIYSGNITVFRGSEKNGYCLLQQPFKVAFVTVPAISHPDLEEKDDGYHIADHLVGQTQDKIRTILRIAGKYRHDTLVLGAFGCGAFANPPNHMAELFKAVFSEPEFKTKFRLAVFAITSDHNSKKSHNPHGNVLPFLEVFDKP